MKGNKNSRSRKLVLIFTSVLLMLFLFSIIIVPMSSSYELKIATVDDSSSSSSDTTITKTSTSTSGTTTETVDREDAVLTQESIASSTDADTTTDFDVTTPSTSDTTQDKQTVTEVQTEDTTQTETDTTELDATKQDRYMELVESGEIEETEMELDSSKELDEQITTQDDTNQNEIPDELNDKEIDEQMTTQDDTTDLNDVSTEKSDYYEEHKSKVEQREEDATDKRICDVDNEGISDKKPADSDGDGISDYWEELLGSDPNDANSVPSVLSKETSDEKEQQKYTTGKKQSSSNFINIGDVGKTADNIANGFKVSWPLILAAVIGVILLIVVLIKGKLIYKREDKKEKSNIGKATTVLQINK